VKSSFRSALRTLLGPALRWFRGQLEVIELGIAAIQERQDDLLARHRTEVAAHEGDVEVVGRALAQQRVAIERLEAEIRELREELRAARHDRPGTGSSGSPAPTVGR